MEQLEEQVLEMGHNKEKKKQQHKNKKSPEQNKQNSYNTPSDNKYIFLQWFDLWLSQSKNTSREPQRIKVSNKGCYAQKQI